MCNSYDTPIKISKIKFKTQKRKINYATKEIPQHVCSVLAFYIQPPWNLILSHKCRYSPSRLLPIPSFKVELASSVAVSLMVIYFSCRTLYACDIIIIRITQTARMELHTKVCSTLCTVLLCSNCVISSFILNLNNVNILHSSPYLSLQECLGGLYRLF